MQYHKVGLLAVREGRILLCRKNHSTSLLILPGGCFEPEESAEDCLARELREELGDVHASALTFLGDYFDRAAGDPSSTVRIELYCGELAGDPVASSEIRELVWFGEHDDRAALAPSLSNKILPDLIARGVLPWRR
ncbi:MAG TPA: NUDIX domain-containing protein [Bryobacteraceae bacterium]|nr:NUDIX domain-containing protein [Bryobacteraceae bacterium]